MNDCLPASRPAWARELKLGLGGRLRGLHLSRPAWARELKLLTLVGMNHKYRRAPRGRVN